VGWTYIPLCGSQHNGFGGRQRGKEPVPRALAALPTLPDLTDEQAATLRKIKRRGGDLWRAYSLKEALRAVFAGDLNEADVATLLDRFCAKASRSRLAPFVTLARTIRSDERASSPRYAWASPTPDTKASTAASGSSSTAPTDFTPPTQPSA